MSSKSKLCSLPSCRSTNPANSPVSVARSVVGLELVQNVEKDLPVALKLGVADIINPQKFGADRQYMKASWTEAMDVVGKEIALGSVRKSRESERRHRPDFAVRATLNMSSGRSGRHIARRSR